MTKVLTFGVFDYFHYGHLKLLERCKKLGDYLVVALQNDDQILINKPNAKVLYSFNERKEMLEAIRYVDKVVPYNQVVDDVKKIDFDILVVGGDQNHGGFVNAIEWCKENGKKVVFLERTPNICSSEIKKSLSK